MAEILAVESLCGGIRKLCLKIRKLCLMIRKLCGGFQGIAWSQQHSCLAVTIEACILYSRAKQPILKEPVKFGKIVNKELRSMLF